MKFEVVASGSLGNLSIISTESTSIVIDAGISYRQMKSRVVNLKEKYDALVITHEHADHTKFLNTLSKNLKAKIYMNHDSFNNCNQKYKDGLNIDDIVDVLEEAFVVGDIKVTPFRLSHDAAGIFGYMFDDGKSKITYMTDTGYVKEEVIELVKNCNTYLIESNHEVEMVLVSSRPFLLKQRILSQKGHLSNEECSNIVNKIAGPDTKNLVFMHLSRECNSPEMANLTHKSYIKDIDKFNLIYANQDVSTGEIDV